jgi:hypothetical protein
MTKPMIRIHDLSTDELIDREMTDAEFEQFKTSKLEIEAKKIADEAKTAAKEAAQAKLAALGLTTDDLRALGL